MGKGGNKTTKILPKPVPRAAAAYGRQLKMRNDIKERDLTIASHNNLFQEQEYKLDLNMLWFLWQKVSVENWKIKPFNRVVELWPNQLH